MVSGWIIADNGLAFSRTIAGLVGAPFVEEDWAVIAADLAGTEAGDDTWLAFRLAGQVEAVEVLLARSQAAPVLFIRAEGEPGTEAVIEGVIAAMEAYRQAPL